MTATVSSLRIQFPEFGDTTVYPDSIIQMWLTTATHFVNADKWGDSTDLGVLLFACHRVALARMASTARTPGQYSGILTSKGADGISAGYDASAITLEGKGHWNLTTYGLQFQELANLFGMGPVQVGAEDGSSAASVWYGVIQPRF